MSLLSVLVTLVVVGIIVWLIQLAPFVDARFKRIAFWAAVVFVVVWLLKAVGAWSALSNVHL